MSRNDNYWMSLSLHALNPLKCTLKPRHTGALCNFSPSARGMCSWTSPDKERKVGDVLSHFCTNNHSALCQWNFCNLSVLSQIPQAVWSNNGPDSWRYFSRCLALIPHWCLLEASDTEAYLWFCACLSAFECLTDVLNRASISHSVTPVLLLDK